MTQHSDQEILALCKDPASQRRAFTLLVEKYQSKLYWMIRRMVYSHADTDDILQNTYIKIWTAINTFREDASLFSWMYRIAYNETITFISQKKRELNLSDMGFCDYLENILDDNINIDCDALEKKLQKAILQLPDMQRLVFQLRYYDDFSYDDIATITGVSKGGLKSSYHIAAKKIEKIMLSD
jgi:RNA polymerase sigma factor (sigma-70 family)